MMGHCTELCSNQHTRNQGLSYTLDHLPNLAPKRVDAAGESASQRAKGATLSSNPSPSSLGKSELKRLTQASMIMAGLSLPDGGASCGTLAGVSGRVPDATRSLSAAQSAASAAGVG